MCSSLDIPPLGDRGGNVQENIQLAGEGGRDAFSGVREVALAASTFLFVGLLIYFS